jgi:ParB family chromosome partitioning protein
MIAPTKPVEIEPDRPDEAPDDPKTPNPTPLIDGLSSGVQDSSAADGPDAGVRHVRVDRIRPSPFQPRRSFDAAALATLADSIRRSGVMQPIVVRPTGSGFELIAGERRWRAAEAAGLETIPAAVRELGDEQAAEWALVENLQREDLNPIERGAAFRELADRFNLTQAEIGERVGLDRSSVANLMRLTELEEPIRRLVAAGALGLGHARALLRIPAGVVRTAIADRAAREGWTARRIEAAARDAVRAPAAPQAPAGDGSRARAVGDLEKQLGEHLGTKVRIQTDRSGKKGRLVIEFYDLDHFDSVTQRAGFRPDL